MSGELADDLLATRKRIAELEAEVADAKDDLAAVEDALSNAGYWGCVDVEVQNFAEAIELMAQNLSTRESALQVAREALGHIRLRCSCANWMGGCSGEADCSLGWLREAKKALARVEEVSRD